MKRDNRFTQPTKTMPVEFVTKMYDIVDKEFNKVTKDVESAHMKAKVHKLTQLENELAIAERKLAKAFTQHEYNKIQDSIDNLEGRIAKINQELNETRPEWMIKLLRKVA